MGKNHLVINPRVFFYLTTVVQFLSAAPVFYVQICFIFRSVGICAENFLFCAQSPLLVNFTQWCVGGARYLCSTHAQPDRRTPRLNKAHKKYSNLKMLKVDLRFLSTNDGNLGIVFFFVFHPFVLEMQSGK